MAFSLAIEINILRGHTNMDCGCFGAKNRTKISIKVLLRDLIFLILSIFVAVGGGGELTLEYQYKFLELSLTVNILRDTLLPIILIIISTILLIKLVI